MSLLPPEFEACMNAVLDGTADRDQRACFQTCLRANPDLLPAYVEQAEIHAALLAMSDAKGEPEGANRETESTRSAKPLLFIERWWKVAAAAVLLLGGAAVWQSVPLLSGVADCRLPIADLRPLITDLRSPTSDLRSPTSVFPVTLVSQSGVRGLDLPDALPGTVRLSAGEAVVRLGSGVRLTVLGPASLEVNSVMEVTLEKGRLLADVPHWATGFRVRTADLEVCDLGTVFSVSVDWPVCDVFVFKGRVRVNEAGHGGMENETAGEGLGICEAGEGVRAEAGERPVKFAADWPAAKKLFAAVRDKALTEKPALALATAERIADLWVEATLPREMARWEARRLAAASAPKIPFRKTAWVRPSASLQQEASNMKTTGAAAVLTAAAVMMGAGTSGAVSEPVLVDLSPHTDNGRWTTVFTNAVPLQWDWPATATSAELNIVGMNGSFVTNFTTVTSNCLWRAFASDVPSVEDAYALTLTFKNSGRAVVGALTSQLSVVTGAFGETPVNPALSDPKWDKVKDNVLIPYDTGWTEATAAAASCRLVIAKVGGAAQTNVLADAVGYFGWKLKHSDWGYGTFNLTLAFPGTVTNVWDAALTRPMDGTMIRMQ